VLVEVGHKGDLISKIQDSLISLQRLLAFDLSLASERKPGKAIDHRIKTLAVDVQALRDHAGFLTQKISFLLDATLGMINIQQTAIIKIFSVAAVVFLPPTLIASVYGKNCKHMPELDWAPGSGAHDDVGCPALPFFQMARLALRPTPPEIPAAGRVTERGLPPSAHGRGP
jgi:magnesium transporter